MVIPPVQALFVVEVVPIWVTVEVVVGVAVRTSLSQSCAGSMTVVVMAMVWDREDGNLSVSMVVTFHPIFSFLSDCPFPLCHHSYLILWLTTPC